MAHLVTIALLIVSLYTVILIVFSIGLIGKKYPGYSDPEDIVGVTLVIPYRNEAEYLPGLVSNLFAQTYPAEMFQVIFVDDHSVDDSRNVIEALLADRAGYACLSLPKDKHGKKEAVHYGIQHAEYEWIIQIDADCRVGDRFIAAHIFHLEKYPSDLVAGLVTTVKKTGRFLEQFERLDLCSLAGVGAASFIFNRPMICSGANLAYSKELYLQTRSYDPSSRVASGDDMFLMIGARKLGRTLSYVLSPESVVRTFPVKNLSSFLDQRVRWGSKTLHYRQWDIQLLAVLVVLTNISMLLIPVWIFCIPDSWSLWLGAWFTKTVADGALLYHATRWTKQSSSMKMFPAAALAYYPVFLMIMIRSIWGTPGWKEGGSK